ncbi:MAG: transporter substrate-binding domain-containing protein [Clostridiales bacterium]|nr:transporter substrate-binding domain-containing protein [Clostridiales bacterium]
MRINPYKIGKSSRFGISPRIKQRFNKLPTLKGPEGKWWRRGLIAVGVILLALIVYHFLKPETSLMSSVEVKRVENRGMLTVGVRYDMPGFSEDGEGLEVELAMLLARKLLPDSDDPLKLVECTSKTVSTKLKDGTIDVAIALQTKSSSYACSYPYFTDKVYLVTLNALNKAKTPPEMRIGYIPETAAGSVFSAYVLRVTSAAERTLVDKILGRPTPTPDPATAVTIDAVKLGSYDELISALKSGEIDAAVMAGAYVTKYFDVSPELSGVGEYYLCDTVIGSLEYCIVASKDDPAFASIADMLIYRLNEDGTLKELKQKYGLFR